MCGEVCGCWGCYCVRTMTYKEKSSTVPSALMTWWQTFYCLFVFNVFSYIILYLESKARPMGKLNDCARRANVCVRTCCNPCNLVLFLSCPLGGLGDPVPLRTQLLTIIISQLTSGSSNCSCVLDCYSHLNGNCVFCGDVQSASRLRLFTSKESPHPWSRGHLYLNTSVQLSSFLRLFTVRKTSLHIFPPIRALFGLLFCPQNSYITYYIHELDYDSLLHAIDISNIQRDSITISYLCVVHGEAQLLPSFESCLSSWKKDVKILCL